MIRRFSSGACRPSARARCQPMAYQAQLTPFSDKVSPIVLAACGGKGWRRRSVPFGSAKSRLPSAAGGTPLGWYGGCVVLMERLKVRAAVLARIDDPALGR